MKKLFSLFLLAAPALLFCQSEGGDFHKFLEAGPMFGFTNYAGDVAENRVQIGETKVGFGFFVRSHQTAKLSMRAHFFSSRISGADANSPNLAARGLTFFSPILEYGGQIEWNVFGKEHVTGQGVHQFHATPYLFVGVAGAHANPSVEQKAGGTPLSVPIPEPGLKKNFFTAPVGVGGRFDFLDRLVISGEVGFRPVFSDDLDGVSANGNNNKNDWYYTLTGSLAYVIGNPYKRK